MKIKIEIVLTRLCMLILSGPGCVESP
jgi:hypothetical protein